MIVAGEASDLYEEIKELYGVAERGNSLQVGRALSNVRQLEQEAKRLMDEVRATTRDQATLRQVESQTAALEALRRAVPEVAPEAEAAVRRDQQGEGPARGVTERGVNEGYRKQAPAAEAEGVWQVREYGWSGFF